MSKEEQNVSKEQLPGAFGSFLAGLFWGPIGIIYAAIRALRNPARDEAIITGGWAGAILQVLLVIIIMVNLTT